MPNRNDAAVFAFCLNGRGHYVEGEELECLNGCGTDMAEYVELNGGTR